MSVAEQCTWSARATATLGLRRQPHARGAAVASRGGSGGRP